MVDRRMVWLFVTLSVLGAGCKGGTKKLSKSEVMALTGCIERLQALPTEPQVEGTDDVNVVAQACGSVAAGDPAATLRGVGDWLTRMRGRAGKDQAALVADLDTTLAKVHFPLAPAAPAGTALAAGDGRPSSAVSWVVVDKDRVRAGLVPVMQLTAKGAEVAEPAADEVAIDKLDEKLRQLHAASFRGAGDRLAKVAVKPEEELPEESPEEVEEVPPQEVTGGTGTKMAGPEGRMGKRDSSRPEGRYQIADHGAGKADGGGIIGALNRMEGGAFAHMDLGLLDSKPSDQAPLVYADRSLGAARLLEVLEKLQVGAWIAVAGSAGVTRHPVGFPSWGNDPLGGLQPEPVRLTVDDNGYELAGARLPRKGKAYDLAGLTTALADLGRAKDASLALAFQGAATVQDLVDVLTELGKAGVRWNAGMNSGLIGETGWGYGVAGTGGGTGQGTIGLGNYGQLGVGRRRARATRPQVSLGQPDGVSDLDREMIRREVRKNKARFEYCYEKHLIAKPKLAGAVSTSFTITSVGVVRKAKASGVDPAVSSCVAQVMSSIQFPRPSAGKDVAVNFPFFFKQGTD